MLPSRQRANMTAAAERIGDGYARVEAEAQPRLSPGGLLAVVISGSRDGQASGGPFRCKHRDEYRKRGPGQPGLRLVVRLPDGNLDR